MAAAVDGPARVSGFRLEPGLTEVILHDVADEPGALPLLSHALLETWKRRRGRMLTHRGYDDAGGVRSAIARTAESVYGQLDPAQQSLARNLFVRLTDLGEGTADTGDASPSPSSRRGRASPSAWRRCFTPSRRPAW